MHKSFRAALTKAVSKCKRYKILRSCHVYLVTRFPYEFERVLRKRKDISIDRCLSVRLSPT